MSGSVSPLAGTCVMLNWWPEHPFSWNLAIRGTTGTHRASWFADCFQAYIPSIGCKKEAAERMNLCFHVLRCSCRHAARHVQAGHAALGEVHLRHLHRAQRRGELHRLHLQTLWVSVHLWQYTVLLSTFGHVSQLCLHKAICTSQENE